MLLMFNRVFFLAALFTMCLNSAFAAKTLETCGRTALINYQEVLVDTDSSQKGEGLRFYLEKDPLAKELLNDYQEGTTHKFINVIFGVAGTGLVFSSIFVQNNKNKSGLILTGLALTIINFLAASTIEYTNEKVLIKSIEEYNKRNLPRIYFNPVKNESTSEFSPLVMLEKSWSF
jgi:hypothetical protein